MNNKPTNIYKFSNVLKSPLKLAGLVAIILIFAGIATAAWTYTTPPLFDCVANGTCYFGNMKINETTLIAQFFQGDASNLTSVPAAQLTGTAPLAAIPATLTGKDADTVDGYHLNQGVRTTDSPTFAGVNATNLTGHLNASNYNITLAQKVTSKLYEVLDSSLVTIASYVDAYSCDGSYCIYQPWYNSGQVYAKNMSTGKVDYSGSFYTAMNGSISAAANGSRIFMRDSRFVLGATLYINKSIIIEGVGNGTTIDVANAVIPFNISDVSDVKLRNFNLDVSNRDGIVTHNMSNSEISGINFTGNFTPTGSRAALRMYDSVRNSIHNNYFSGTWDNALLVEVSTTGGNSYQYNNIYDNVFYNLGTADDSLADGIAIEVTYQGSSLLPVIGNTISGNRCVDIWGHCLRLVASQYNAVTGNTAYNISASMIWMQTDNVSSYNTISNNVALNASTGNKGHAVYRIGGKNNIVTDNIADTSPEAGIMLISNAYNNTVRNNILLNTTGVVLNNTNAVADNFGAAPYNHGNNANCTTITPFGKFDTCGNTTNNKLMFYNGTAWETVTSS